MATIESPLHFCDLPPRYTVKIGTLFACETCGKKWESKPWTFASATDTTGQWKQISDRRFRKLSGRADLDVTLPPKVGWWKRLFQLDKYPD